MPNYHIEYEAWNEYERHVGESFFSFQILPCFNDKQRQIRYKISNSINESFFINQNHYGFEQLNLRALKPFSSFQVNFECDVHVKKYNPFEFNSISSDEEIRALEDLDFIVQHHLFLQPSPFTSLPMELLDGEWIKKADERVFDFLSKINSKIYSEFEFIMDVTDVHSSAKDTFQILKGVCQDFAHVFISIARKNKIPCRYVSGYLNQGEGFIGTTQMHAWVEAYVPKVGWIGFDPTNNVLQDHHYVKVCHGTDYSECGPIKGIIKVSGDQKTKYAVKVIQQ